MCQLSEICDLYSVWSKGTALYTRWADTCGIGYPELIVLYTLRIKDHLTQKAITEESGLVKPTVNTVIRSLKSRGLVHLEPAKNDKREKLVFLTESGDQYAHERIDPLLKAEKEIAEKIGSRRIEQAIETMELFNLLFEHELKRRTTTDE